MTSLNGAVMMAKVGRDGLTIEFSCGQDGSPIGGIEALIFWGIVSAAHREKTHDEVVAIVSEASGGRVSSDIIAKMGVRHAQ